MKTTTPLELEYQLLLKVHKRLRTNYYHFDPREREFAIRAIEFELLDLEERLDI